MLFSGHITYAQKEINLYDGKVPNSIPQVDSEYTDNYKAVFKVSIPKLYVFLPTDTNKTGTAVIICPGGGYYGIVMQQEGYQTAEYYAKHGVTAFVLKYRIPNDSYIKDKSIAPLQDAQQAMKWVREHAAEYSVRPDHIGVMGFSAGGHLAAMVSTHFSESYIPNPDHTSLRPDFTILIYPVISMTDQIGHIGSRDNILGKNPSKEKIDFFSNELHVTADSPPCLLIHTAFDKIVPVINSIVYFEALQKNKVPVQMHLLQNGDHGFVVTTPIQEWMCYCFDWLNINKMLK